MCTSSQIGYAIAIVTPDSIGATFNTSVGKYENVVMAYKASRILQRGDTIYGVAYLTKSYAALNCYGVNDNGLPEVILLSVDD